MKVVHKWSGYSEAICGVHNKTFAFITAFAWKNVTCKRCIKKMSAYSCCGGYSEHTEACWSENSKREIAALKADLKWIAVCAEDLFREGDKGYQIAIFARESLKKKD